MFSGAQVKTVLVGKVLVLPLGRHGRGDSCGSFMCQTPSQTVYLSSPRTSCGEAADRVSTAAASERTAKRQHSFPTGWDEERVRKVLAHYEEQTEDEGVAEDEAASEDSTQTVMEVPHALVPAIRELIAKHQA